MGITVSVSLQDAVRKLNEAQTALDDIHKAADAQEAAQAAAEALHPWPADPRLVPPNYPAYPSAPSQLLNADVANLGSYLFSLPGGINAEGLDAMINNDGAEEHPGSAAILLNQVMSKDRGRTDSATRNSKGWQDSHLNMQSQDQQQHFEQPSGWQQQLKSGMSQQQLQQVCCHVFCNWVGDCLTHVHACSLVSYSLLLHACAQADIWPKIHLLCADCSWADSWRIIPAKAC